MLPGISYQTNLNSADVVSSYGVVTVGKMSLTSIARRQQTISTAPPDYFGYTLQDGKCELAITPCSTSLMEYSLSEALQERWEMDHKRHPWLL